MSRELTALDSVLEIERQVHQQETDLKAQLQKAERRKKLRSIMLTTPLVCFILLTFAFPILDMRWSTTPAWRFAMKPSRAWQGPR